MRATDCSTGVNGRASLIFRRVSRFGVELERGSRKHLSPEAGFVILEPEQEGVVRVNVEKRDECTYGPEIWAIASVNVCGGQIMRIEILNGESDGTQ